jgi:small subunit ribosomal protein S20
MANHKATEKDTRQVKKRRERNRYQGKTTRNAIRKVAASATFDDAAKELAGTISMIDKLAKNTVIHKNKASNLKSKLAKKVNAMKNAVAEKPVKAKAKKAAVKKKATKK